MNSHVSSDSVLQNIDGMRIMTFFCVVEQFKMPDVTAPSLANGPVVRGIVVGYTQLVE